METWRNVMDQLRRNRRALFIAAGIGFLVYFLLLFIARSRAGFLLIGPLAFCPWCLACAGLSKSNIAAIPLLAFAAVGLLSPLLYFLI